MKWSFVNLADVLGSAEVFVDGDWVESKDQDVNGDVRLIQLADIGDGCYIDKSSRFLTSDKARELRCTFIEKGDVLVARMPEPLGRACIFPGDSKRTVTVVDVCIIRPKPENHNARWLMHCLNAPICRNQMADFATGTTRTRISRGNLAKIKIPLPPLAEQKRIAEILDRAEELRSKRREAIAQLDTLTQAIFFEMFGDPATNQKDFPSLPLKDVCSEVNDCPHSTPNWTEEGLICLRTSNITVGGWKWDDTRYVSEQTYQQRSKRGYLQQGDIVLSREGTVGIAAIVMDGMRMCMGQRLVQVRPNPSLLVSEFLLRHLLYVLDPLRIGQVMVGSTSQHLNVKELRMLQIPTPHIDLQHKFARRVEAIEKLKAAHRASLSELDALFASLQHRAFRGEL